MYSDYLIVNQGQTTETRLAALLEGHFSYDQLTRSLNRTDLVPAQLWQLVKPFVQQVARPDGVLVLDDTVEEKPYSQTADQYDHGRGRCVKGLNQPHGRPRHRTLS